MTRAHMLGALGEDAAVGWYECRGYRILARNWRSRTGELDVVARTPDGLTFVFCEVKTRTSDAYGHPAEALTTAKRRRLHRLAAEWLAQVPLLSRRWSAEIRFDVACVTRGSGQLRGVGDLEVDVIEAAF